jgi:hypothetical protein
MPPFCGRRTEPDCQYLKGVAGRALLPSYTTARVVPPGPESYPWRLKGQHNWGQAWRLVPDSAMQQLSGAIPAPDFGRLDRAVRRF